MIVVQIYVDDIIFYVINDSLCEEFSKCVHNEFKISMIGELNFFLGLQKKQAKEEIFINQSKYIKDLSKPMRTPISSATKIDKDENDKMIDITKYRGMIGSSLYLTASKPDIMVHVC